MKIELIPQTESTNSYVKRMASPESMTMVRAVAQTAGRGQRGNSWESEPGKNLTFSIFFRPEGLLPSEQFAISEATSLGVTDFLRSHGVQSKVKWPNDIYSGDRKICGILIEHSIMGREIQGSVIGVGVNVNQEVFVSDAPNPVSMIQLTGAAVDLEAAAREIGEAIERRLGRISTEDGRRKLHEEYLGSLWRGEGLWAFRDKASGERIMARIVDVEPGGVIILEEESGKRRSYAFKEMEFIL